MLGIDGVDLIIIIVLAVVLFGPERLPEFSRKAARVFVYLRDVANNAKSTLGNELGPEYANLELKDLNPKTFIANQLREEVALIDEAKRELKEATGLLKSTAKEAEDAVRPGVTTPEGALVEPPATAAELVEEEPATPFDPEAT